MATIRNLNNMQLSGKIGDIVFCTSRSGRTYVRKRSVMTREPTEKQLACRLRMKMASAFLNPLIHVIRDTWKPDNKKGHTEINRAMSAMVRYAFMGDYPDISINYPEVALSEGSWMMQAEGLRAGVTEGQLSLTWSFQQGRRASSDDQATVVLVDPRTSAVQILRDCATRVDTQATIPLSSSLSSGLLHLYFIFVSKYGRFIARTQYLQIIH